VESVAALALFGLAVIVAAGFLDAHMSAARRLVARSELVRAAEQVLEGARGGAIPMISGEVRLDDLERGGKLDVTTTMLVTPRSTPGLFEVRAVARTTVRSEVMEVAITTQVWRP
jgi:hypothetical protein